MEAFRGSNMDKSFYFFVISLSGCLMMPYIAMPLDNLTAKPQGKTISEAPAFEETSTPNCTFQQLHPPDVIPEKGKLLIKDRNLTLPNDQLYVFDPVLKLCFARSETLNKEIFDKCSKRKYEEGEYRVLQNGSVKLHEVILEPGFYAVKDGNLEICADDYGDSDDGGNATGNIEMEVVSNEVYDHDNWFWRVGSLISIVALTAHLVSFCLVPTQRNMPLYNLASMSVSFLLGYISVLIAQLSGVLGPFCVTLGVFRQFYCMVGFCCMSSLGFHVWRTITISINKLASFSHKSQRRYLIYYSIYSWGTPLLISAITLAMDNLDGTPTWTRAGFGHNGVCYFTNFEAFLVFYRGPCIVLWVMNGIFFTLCAFLIKTNTMTSSREEQLQQTAARNNFVIYFRLFVMLGLTWLLGIVAAFVDNFTLRIVNDLVNSLQGLFIFLLFTCSKEVFLQVMKKLHLDAMMCTPKMYRGTSSRKTVVTQKT